LQDFQLIAALVVFTIIIWLLRSPSFKGALGERRVKRSLRAQLSEDDYRLFHDLTLPVRGGTTQIDHIVVSRFGVFIIETKNMRGWIFGSADQAVWTQVLFRRKSKFQNPIRQNYKHVKAVQELLHIKAHLLHGVVAFVGSGIPKSAMPPGVVWGVQSLVEHIKAKRFAVLSEEEVRTFAASLSDSGLKSNIRTRRAHVRHVKADVATTCPKCGAPLVQRTNRQSGNSFLSCSTFPVCRGTRKLS